MTGDDGASKGNALITFTAREQALAAIKALKGNIIEGAAEPLVIKFANHSSIGGYQSRGGRGGRGGRRGGRGRGGHRYNSRGSCVHAQQNKNTTNH